MVVIRWYWRWWLGDGEGGGESGCEVWWRWWWGVLNVGWGEGENSSEVFMTFVVQLEWYYEEDADYDEAYDNVRYHTRPSNLPIHFEMIILLESNIKIPENLLKLSLK